MEHGISQKSIDIIEESAHVVVLHNDAILLKMCEIILKKYSYLGIDLRKDPENQYLAIILNISKLALIITNGDKLEESLQNIAKNYSNHNLKSHHFFVIGRVFIDSLSTTLSKKELNVELLNAWRELYTYLASRLIEINKKAVNAL